MVRDLRRMRKQGKDRKKYKLVVSLLLQNAPLPKQCRPHKLGGEWQGAWECHIESDWLLIYEPTPNALILYRTGTHDDLFE
jgi:mRNA interferase YafQ